MRFRFRWLLVAAALLTVVWFYYTPRRTWDRFLRGVVLAREADLQATIDFPVLRANLRADLGAAVQRSDNPGVVAKVGGLVLDQIVDRMVTPAGLTSLVTAFGTRTPGAADQDSLDARTVTSFDYQGPSTVEVRLRPAAADAREAGVFTFTRSGLDWRLTRIRGDRFNHLGESQ